MISKVPYQALPKPLKIDDNLASRVKFQYQHNGSNMLEHQLLIPPQKTITRTQENIIY